MADCRTSKYGLGSSFQGYRARIPRLALDGFAGDFDLAEDRVDLRERVGFFAMNAG